MRIDKNNFFAKMTGEQMEKYNVTAINVETIIWFDGNKKPVPIFTGNFSCSSNKMAKKISNRIYNNNIRMIQKWMKSNS